MNAGEIESARSIRFNGMLTSYFHEMTLREVLLARRYFVENPAGYAVAIPCFRVPVAYSPR